MEQNKKQQKRRTTLLKISMSINCSGVEYVVVKDLEISCVTKMP